MNKYVYVYICRRWYHQFLLTTLRRHALSQLMAGNTVETNAAPESIAIAYYSGVLAQQTEVMESLLALEPGNKWVLVCLVQLLEHRILAVEKGHNSDLSEMSSYQSTRVEYLNRLIIIDPAHMRRYQYLLKKATSPPVQG